MTYVIFQEVIPGLKSMDTVLIPSKDQENIPDELKLQAAKYNKGMVSSQIVMNFNSFMHGFL